MLLAMYEVFCKLVRWPPLFARDRVIATMSRRRASGLPSSPPAEDCTKSGLENGPGCFCTMSPDSALLSEF